MRVKCTICGSRSLCYNSLFLRCWKMYDSLVGQLTKFCGVRSVDSNCTTSLIMMWQVHITSVETSLISIGLQLQVPIDHQPIFKLSYHVPWSVLVCVWGKEGSWHNLVIWGIRAYPTYNFVWLIWKCNILCAGLQIYKSEMDQLPEFLFVSTIYRGWGRPEHGRATAGSCF